MAVEEARSDQTGWVGKTSGKTCLMQVFLVPRVKVSLPYQQGHWTVQTLG